MSNQLPDKDYVYNGLLRYNYFPMVKEYLDEIPPVFSSKDFTPDIAETIVHQGESRKKGYDQIEYRATRFNNVTRLMHIPHPLPFARLCKCISDNWDKLKHICENAESQIKPAQHVDDRLVILGEYEQLGTGRVVVMEKENFPDSIILKLGLSAGARYRASADISSCFPSIYTHSIPWALVGHNEAKSTSNNSHRDLWYNKLDKCQRDTRRGETQGIPIGPATSNIISEIVLFKVDEVLRDKKYRFIRFIDDYQCYCITREEAEKFIRDLEQELRKFLLNFNVKKVIVEELPLAYSAAWKIDLANHLPTEEKPTARKIVNFLDYAVNLQKHNPEGSVLKYATRSLSKKIDENNAEIYTKYLISIAFHNPIVLPILCEVAKNHINVISTQDFQPVIRQHIKFRRSDAICWCLYFLGMCNENIDVTLADAIIKTEDCMSMAMFIALRQHQEKVAEFLNKQNPESEYDCDQNWILIHELAKKSDKFEKYREKSGLNILWENGVHFINTELFSRESNL
jgi:hypothetical protein